MIRHAALLLVLAALGLASSARAEQQYDVRFEATLLPTERSARVEIHVRQSRHLLKSLAFRIDPDRHHSFSGSGSVDEGDGTVTWEVPEFGGTFQYAFRIDHLRENRSYDARGASEWALFRGDDLVPPARAITEVGSNSRSRLRIHAPDGWSTVTPYPRGSDGVYLIDHPARGFDRPTGWLLSAERLGVVRETISGMAVALAGPTGQGVRRLDMLALLRWTLPELATVLPELPDRMLVVSAGDPMWRGGLSAANSFYIHADRPLMTPNGTSPVLHEVMHVVFARGANGAEDWLVEGLAEYYSLAALVRSKTLSKKRYQRALSDLAKRGRSVRSVRVPRSEGAITARAVTLLVELDGELREASGGGKRLDDVVHQLALADVPLTSSSLRAAAEKVAGADLGDFFDRPVLRAAP